LRRIREPHVAPLNELADEIADAKGLPRGHVPYVDPDCRGIHARALVLLDNPSTKAEAGTGSGLLSLDNNDRTARNIREAYERHHIDGADTVGWNVVPFPVINSNGGSTRAERREGTRWLREFVSRCPNLKTVLLLGRAAQDGWALAGLRDSLEAILSPHPSMRGLNSNGGRERFNAALTSLARALNDG
jgi:hypothetical protein